MLLSALGYAGAALLYRRWLADAPAAGGHRAHDRDEQPGVPGARGHQPAPPAAAGDQRLALLTLGIVNTGLAYWLFYLPIDEAGAATASVITYVMPVVALLLGAGLLGRR